MTCRNLRRFWSDLVKVQEGFIVYFTTLLSVFLSSRLIAQTLVWRKVLVLHLVSKQGQRPALRFTLSLINWGK